MMTEINANTDVALSQRDKYPTCFLVRKEQARKLVGEEGWESLQNGCGFQIRFLSQAILWRAYIGNRLLYVIECRDHEHVRYAKRRLEGGTHD